MDIPIQNIYFLLLYAWRHWQEGKAIDVSDVDSPELVDLFATVLIRGTNHLLRRGLDRGYIEIEEELAGIRGRVDFGTSLKQVLLPRSRTYCRFDEFSHDVLHNQLLKSTFRRLSSVTSLDAGLREQLSLLYRRFDGVADIQITSALFRRVQLHSNNAYYRFLMSVCEFVHAHLLPEEQNGRKRFVDFRRDEAMMWKLYEDFLVGFYRQETPQYKVSTQAAIHWHARDLSPGAQSMLPTMYADLLLESSERVILIDAKYYQDILDVGLYREKFHAANLYQLFAYLKNIEPRGNAFQSAEGILIYPTVRKQIDEAFTVQGHRLRYYALDLARDWKAISADLKRLVIN